MDTALEAATDGCVELPGNVGCAEDENAFGVAADTIHLYQHFSFDTARCFGLAFATGAAESVNFVDEDD